MQSPVVVRFTACKLWSTSQSQEFTAAYKTSAPPQRKRMSATPSDCSGRSTPANGLSDDAEDGAGDCKYGRLMSNRKANRMKASLETSLNPVGVLSTARRASPLLPCFLFTVQVFRSCLLDSVVSRCSLLNFVASLTALPFPPNHIASTTPPIICFP